MVPRPLSVLTLAIIMAVPALQAEVPFAEPPGPGLGQTAAPLPSLSEIMERIQLRHIRLWDAIKFENWDLLAYQLSQARDNLSKAAILYRNIPVEYVIAAAGPLATLETAVKSKDRSKLKPAFDAFTAACNNCHKAAQVGFIVIQTPAAPLFSDQDFRPKH